MFVELDKERTQNRWLPRRVAAIVVCLSLLRFWTWLLFCKQQKWPAEAQEGKEEREKEQTLLARAYKSNQLCARGDQLVSPPKRRQSASLYLFSLLHRFRILVGWLGEAASSTRSFHESEFSIGPRQQKAAPVAFRANTSRSIATSPPLYFSFPRSSIMKLLFTSL